MLDWPIDPYAWALTAPLTIMLVMLYFQPTDHAIKRVWRELARWEADGLSHLMQVAPPEEPGRMTAWHIGLLGGAAVLLAITSALSFAACLHIIFANG